MLITLWTYVNNIMNLWKWCQRMAVAVNFSRPTRIRDNQIPFIIHIIGLSRIRVGLEKLTATAIRWHHFHKFIITSSNPHFWQMDARPSATHRFWNGYPTWYNRRTGQAGSDPEFDRYNKVISKGSPSSGFHIYWCTTARVRQFLSL